MHDRLRKSRIDAGFASAAAAARAMHIPPPTYQGHENGTTPPPREALKVYAAKFKVSVDYLLSGKGSARGGPSKVAIRGYVGAGAAIFMVDDGPIDEMEAPFRCGPDCAAVLVRGDSMRPMMEDGDVLIYEDQTEDASSMLNKRCVVKLADGRIFVKKLRRGTESGLYSLESFNADLIEDVTVEWVARISAILPR